MDISEEYVLMCKASEEIQAIGERMQHTNKSYHAKGDLGVIWMPKQSELQAMIEPESREEKGQQLSPEETYTHINTLADYIKKAIEDNRFIFSMEQACICAVMMVNYDKVWNVKTKEWEIAA